MSKYQNARRRFLRLTTGLAGAAAAVTSRFSPADSNREENATALRWPQIATTETQAYGVRTPYDTSSRIAQLYGARPPASMPGGAPILYAPLQDQTGIITPNSLHFTFFHGMKMGDPIDPREHRLTIHGLVDKPMQFSLDDLKRLPSVSRIHFLECNSNSRPAFWGHEKLKTVQHSHGWASCSEWTGVPLSILLDMAGVKKKATWLLAESVHEGKHSKSVPISKARHDALIVFGQNGELLRHEQGFPMRLLCPGFEGIFNVKFIGRLKVVDEPYMANFETTKYVDIRPDGKGRWFRFEMPPKSVITRPSGGQRLTGKGYHQISGFAWSGGGSIARVEVSTDGGKSWSDAKFASPVLPKAFTRFIHDWVWTGDETTLMSRCTDDLGQVQPTLAQYNEYHRVDMDFWTDPQSYGYGHFNAVQPWKITRDGEVHNAMF